jgi:predicted ribosome quality control (RQC) complex YloA/Tae2 family protein
VALDGILLNQYVKSIQKKLPLKINKVFQYSDHEIVFNTFNQKKVVVYASMHAQTNRLQLLNDSNEKSHQTSNFLQLLKKHLESGTITSCEQKGFDRVVKMKITAKDEVFEPVEYTIAIELMGKYANMILIDENNRIVDALYRIAPYQNSKRIIIPSAPYIEVDSLDKKSPLLYHDEPVDELLEHFEGFSPILAREMEYRIKNNENYHEVLNDLLTSEVLYVANEKPSVFHAIPLTHTSYTFSELDLHEGLTFVYQTLDNKKRIKDITNDVAKTIKRELKKSLSKKEKLEHALLDSKDADEYRIKGDYCYTYANQIHKGME